MENETKQKLRKIKSRFLFSFVAGGLTFFLLNVLFVLLRIAPFGNNSLAVMDAEIQYLDFFAYLHDVLHGNANIFYSFGKTLGGTNVAVFSYYLSSPLNLLVYFFSKENLHIFFSLLIILKLSFAATTCTFYILNRFSLIRKSFAVILGTSFALCQYNFTQASNIMWLDGVFMLPLIMLGIYRFISEPKNFLLLSTSVALSILFNWYTGFINCLFAAFFFLFEWAYSESAKENCFSAKTIKNCVFLGMKCAFFMLLGILFASVLLVPSLVSLKNGRGHIDFHLLKNFSHYLEFSKIIQGFNLGVISSRNHISLFSSSFTLLGLIGIFILPSEKCSTKRKIILSVMALLIALFFCWTPFFVLFSLLKDASSYWFRYSYIGIFFTIACAGFFYEKATFLDAKKMLKAVLIWGGILILMNDLTHKQTKTYETVFIFLFVYVALLATLYSKKTKSVFATTFVLLTFSCLEMTLNGNLLFRRYRTNGGVAEFKKYERESLALIDAILSADSENYRISQTSTRRFNHAENHTANYNEALAFSYRSISGYTSDPDDMQRTLLDSFGYNKNGDNFCIVNTSIVPADSLLGVKYILSRYPIPGLVKKADFGTADEKQVYENPYCLPFAFAYNATSNSSKYNGNSFEYLNSLYSELIGEKIELFHPVNYTIEETSSDFSRKWTLHPQKKSVVYAQIDCGWHNDMFMDVNGVYKQKYAGWCSPRTVFVPTKTDEAKIALESKDAFSVSEVRFYECDYDVLQSTISKLKNNSAQEMILKDGYCEISINASEKQSLYTSIPYSDGWKITVNGKKIAPELFADCLITIPLESGKNEIVMRYTVPGFFLGLVLTIVSLIVLAFCKISEIRRSRANGTECSHFSASTFEEK